MTDAEVKEAVKELVAQKDIVFVLATVDADAAPQCRLMGALVLEGEFEILMATYPNARKVKQIEQNPKAQLLFSTEDYKKVATLSGTAEMEESLETKKKFWDAVPACADYHKSHDAPDFGLMRVKTQSMEYIDLAVRNAPFKVELA